MFDDKQPEDIFEGSDKAPAPMNLPVEDQRIAPAPRLTPPTTPSASASAMGSAPMQEEGHPIVSAKVVLVAIIILGVIGATIAISYSFMSQPQVSMPLADQSVEEDENENDTDTEVVLDDEEGKGDDENELDGLPQTDPAVIVIDSDGDGLSNDEEMELGTSINNPDSDNDGLGDREEIQVYKTNPLNPDTDGDTYSDGVEVQGGYNPNGEGKLLQVPTPQEDSSTSMESDVMVTSDEEETL
ncbi:hypothetical protein KBC55_00795 [Patescibacteria group bacterium]|nr:hypothetical protein [Patescibacteria group bacterium]